MPIYEYYCDSCRRTIEQIQRMSDPELVKLDGCVSGVPCQLKKLFSVCVARVGGQKEFDPPMPHTPMGETITRDWMEPDGTIKPLKPGEYSGQYVGREA